MASELTSRSIGLIILETASCLLLNAISLVGNVLVCLAVYRNPRLRTTTNIYIIALAVSDLLSATIVMPLAASALIEGQWTLGEITCKFQAFFTLFAVYVCPSTMGLMALNRYVRIVKFNRYNIIFTPTRSKLFVAFVWLFVAIYVLAPKLAGWTEYGFIPAYAVCTVIPLTEAMKIAHYSIAVFLYLVLPLAVASVCYYKIYKVIRSHNVSFSQRARREKSVKIMIKEIKITKSLFAVVLAFSLCWIPFWIIAVMQRFSLPALMPRNVQLFCTFLLFSSNAINPFIYAGMNGSFRREFRKMFGCRASGDASLDSTSHSRRQNIEIQNVNN